MTGIKHAARIGAIVGAGAGVGWLAALIAFYLWLEHNDGEWETPWLTALA